MKKMYSKVKKSVILASLLILAGCSTWQQQQSKPPLQTTQYNQAKSLPPVKAPAGLSSDNLVNHYPISSGPTTNQELLTPTPTAVPPANGLSIATPVKPSLPATAQQNTPNYVANNAAPATASPKPVMAPAPTSGPVIVTVNYDYSQAWDKVGQALRSSGYRVLQQDSSLGRYYVLDLAGTNGQLKRSTPIYQVHLIEIGNGKTQLNLLDSNNKPADGNASRRILGAVQQKLAS
jgi:uncharacterized lipoprotein